MVTSYLCAGVASKLRRAEQAAFSAVGFPLLSQPVLVALDTGRGVVYAPAFGWDRVHLIWTFRNFRSLPQTVLSPRQQQLMGSLYREAPKHQVHAIQDPVVAGRVENFNPASLSALPSSTKRKFGTARTRSEYPSAPGKRRPLYARFAFHRITLKAGAGALVALIAVLAWHELKAQPIGDATHAPAPSGTISISIETGGPVVAQPSPNSVAIEPSPISIADTNSIAAAIPIAAPESSAEPLAKTPVVASKLEPDSFALKAHHPAAASRYSETSADQPRVRISGRPRKLVYPVCPETGARGKVSLQAVVGYDGAVSRVRILTGDRVLAAAAVQAIRQWRYEPFSGVIPGLERETNITVSFISNEVVAVSFPNAEDLPR